MVTVSATYSPHKGHSLTCHHLLCICKNLSPSEVPRDRDSIFFFQWASTWLHSHQCIQSYKKIVSAAQIYILEYFHLQEILYTKKSCRESAFREWGLQLTIQLQA